MPRTYQLGLVESGTPEDAFGASRKQRRSVKEILATTTIGKAAVVGVSIGSLAGAGLLAAGVGELPFTSQSDAKTCKANLEQQREDMIKTLRAGGKITVNVVVTAPEPSAPDGFLDKIIVSTLNRDNIAEDKIGDPIALDCDGDEGPDQYVGVNAEGIQYPGKAVGLYVVDRSNTLLGNDAGDNYRLQRLTLRLPSKDSFQYTDGLVAEPDYGQTFATILAQE